MIRLLDQWLPQRGADAAVASLPLDRPANLPPRPAVEPRSRRVLRLAGDDVLAETIHGFHLVVPAWNIDVGIGIIRDGVIEPWTNAVFMSLLGAGDRVVNVGANFGYYSVLAAQTVGRSGRVYAVEANPVVFTTLLKSIYWSGYPDVIHAYNCAAVHPEAHGTTLPFAFDPQFIGGGNLFKGAAQPRPLAECLWSGENVRHLLDADRRYRPAGLMAAIDTEGRTLDSLVDTPVEAMLIDAEGSESLVIAGARELIRRSPSLAMVMEWAPHAYQVDPSRRPHIDAMWDFLLDEQGFQAARICPEGYRGVGHMPRLDPLTRETLFHVPHSDLLLRRP